MIKRSYVKLNLKIRVLFWCKSYHICVFQSPKMSQYVVKCPEIDNCILITKTSDGDLILTPYPYHQICMLNDPKCCQVSQNQKSCVKLKLEMPILFWQVSHTSPYYQICVLNLLTQEVATQFVCSSSRIYRRAIIHVRAHKHNAMRTEEYVDTW